MDAEVVVARAAAEPWQSFGETFEPDIFSNLGIAPLAKPLVEDPHVAAGK